MKELNELVELVKEYNSATTAEEALAINNKFKATANRETILAIAEAFRALEQRASNLNDGWLNAISDRDEARAKLSELEQQSPVAYLTWHQGFRSPDDCEDYLVVASNGDKSCDGSEPFPVFTRPAPAADLAELLEGDATLTAGVNALVDCLEDCGDAEQGLRLALRAILRNIEETK